MPQPTFSDMQSELETRSRDLAADVESLQQWPMMEWPELIKKVKYLRLNIKLMANLAADMERWTESVTYSEVIEPAKDEQYRTSYDNTPHIQW